MQKISSIFNKLLQTYGPQGWWPVTRKGFHPTYDGGPENDKQRFEVIVGAILTQNTSWKNVEKAIYELKKNGLIDVNRIKKGSTEKLALLIKSAGYYNQKAIKLKTMGGFLDDNPIRDLDKMETKELRQKFLGINGVGPETADSILLYAFNRPVFVVDAYTKRIFSRMGFFNEKTSYDEVQDFFMKNLTPDAKMYNEFHALIVEHAKRHCSKKPKCHGCLLHMDCKNQQHF